MDEIRLRNFLKTLDPNDVSAPFDDYVILIKGGESPYFEIAKYALLEMAKIYPKDGKTEIVYTINPRTLQGDLEKEFVKKFGEDWYKESCREIRKKLTSVNVTRCLRAMMLGRKLEEDEDWYLTTTSRGRKNYHFKVNCLFSPRFV